MKSNIIKIFVLFQIFSISYGQLLVPENFAQLNTLHVLFKWEQIPNATEYNIQISNSNSFNNNSIIRDTNIFIPLYIEKDFIEWEDTFFWRVRPIYENDEGAWIGQRRFFVLENKVDVNLTYINPDSTQSGLTIFGDDGQLLTGVYDESGRCIWHDGDLDVMMNYVNEYGQIFGFSGNNWPNRTGIEFNYFNDIIWRGPNGVFIDGHEFKQIPNNNYMGFVEEFRQGPIPIGEWTSLYQALGYEADGVTNEFPWLGNKLVEWDRETKEVIWSWDPFDYFSFDEYDIYGGTWYYSTDVHDWMHSNAFYFDQNQNSIYMSHRHLSRITKIDYPSGEIEWIMGLPCPYMNNCENHICTNLEFSFQHHISVAENGNLLFFDNGNMSDILNDIDSPQSRALELRVNENNECEIVWEYFLPEDLFGPFHGSVQRLENDNYLINSAGMYGTGDHGGTIIEVTNSKNIVSVSVPELNSNMFPWGANVYSYRAYRIPSLYPNAFSVLMNDYKTVENENLIDSENNQISFTIFNESSYNQPFKINFQDLDNLLFEDIDTIININSLSNHTLTISSLNNNISSTNINVNIYPVHHSYDYYENELHVNITNILNGDLNLDEIINILDIIVLINNILNSIYIQNGDMNNDGIINILDIVLLVNIILDS